jgi:V8-like Glu-specific endopeptidase
MGKGVLTAALVLGAALNACGKSESRSDTDNVFGTDNRTPMTQTTGIYRSIGMVRKGTKFCTGALVWHNIVLTNAHCTIGGSGSLSFTAGEGTSSEETQTVFNVWTGTTDPSGSRAKDWALLKLTHSMNRPYFGYKSQQNLNPFTANLTMVGYSGDYYSATGHAGIHQGCKVRGDENNYYLHDCDTKGGSSGGPIFAETSAGKFIVAINAASRYCGPNQQECANGVAYNDSRANIAVKTNAFSARLTELRTIFAARD